MPGSRKWFETRRTKRNRRCAKCSLIIRKKSLYCRVRQRESGGWLAYDLCCACGAEEIESSEVKPKTTQNCLLF